MRVYILLMGVAFATSYMLTPVMRRLGLRVMGSAPLRARDVHEVPIPKLGGVAMIAGILAGLLVASQIPFLDGVFSDTSQVMGVVVAAGLILLIGVADDIWDLRWYVKFVGQTLVGLAVAFSRYELDDLTRFVSVERVP